MKSDDRFGLAMLALLGIFGLLVLSPIYSGFVLLKLWAWFVVPVFGLPKLSLAYAIGIGYTAWALLGTYDSASTEEAKKAPWRTLGMALLRPGVLLLCGWAVKFFV